MGRFERQGEFLEKSDFAGGFDLQCGEAVGRLSADVGFLPNWSLKSWLQVGMLPITLFCGD
jgi:hypothetical protein